MCKKDFCVNILIGFTKKLFRELLHKHLLVYENVKREQLVYIILLFL